MAQSDKKRLELFAKALMPDIYEAQKMWNRWDEFIKSLAKNSSTSDTNSDSYREEMQASSEQKEEGKPAEE